MRLVTSLSLYDYLPTRPVYATGRKLCEHGEHIPDHRPCIGGFPGRMDEAGEFRLLP